MKNWFRYVLFGSVCVVIAGCGIVVAWRLSGAGRRAQRPEKKASPGGGSAKEKGPRETYGPRTFNSELNLAVRVLTGKGRWEKVGTTPSEEPLRIPECRGWAVKPISERKGFAGAGEPNVDWPALAEEIRRKRVPGLYAPSGTRARDIAHLEGLQNLRKLDLDHTEVTDEGVRKLKEVLPKVEVGE